MMKALIVLRSRLLGPAVLISLIVFTAVLFAQPRSAEAADTNVDVGDVWFCQSVGACDTLIEVGDTVTWTWVGVLPHNVVECGDNWSKGFSCTGADWTSATQTSSSYNRQFNTSGITYYLCTVHPTTMRGTVTVASAVGGIAELPSAMAFTVESPNPTAGDSQLLIALAAGGAAAIAAVGAAFWYMRRKLA